MKCSRVSVLGCGAGARCRRCHRPRYRGFVAVLMLLSSRAFATSSRISTCCRSFSAAPFFAEGFAASVSLFSRSLASSRARLRMSATYSCAESETRRTLEGGERGAATRGRGGAQSVIEHRLSSSVLHHRQWCQLGAREAAALQVVLGEAVRNLRDA